jgi:hypothetical protein
LPLEKYCTGLSIIPEPKSCTSTVVEHGEIQRMEQR